MRNVSLETCIEWAWGVQNYQISGPEGILPEKYDIFAKTGAPVSPDRMKLTRQTLLAERMKLATLVFVGRPVTARTGIKEFFDFTVHFGATNEEMRHVTLDGAEHRSSR